MKFEGIYNQDVTLELGDAIAIDQTNKFVYVKYRDSVLKAPLKDKENLERISNANSVGFFEKFNLPKNVDWEIYIPKK